MSCTESDFRPYRITGKERDSVAEGGLDHFWFRQYSSTQGRWLTPDPAGLAAVDITNPQSWNRYAYVTNNPTGFIDPLGLDQYGFCPAEFASCSGGWGGPSGVGAVSWGGGGVWGETTWSGNMLPRGFGLAAFQAWREGLTRYFTDLDGPSLFPKNYEFTPEQYAAALSTVLESLGGDVDLPNIGDGETTGPVLRTYGPLAVCNATTTVGRQADPRIPGSTNASGGASGFVNIAYAMLSNTLGFKLGTPYVRTRGNIQPAASSPRQEPSVYRFSYFYYAWGAGQIDWFFPGKLNGKRITIEGRFSVQCEKP